MLQYASATVKSYLLRAGTTRWSHAHPFRARSALTNTFLERIPSRIHLSVSPRAYIHSDASVVNFVDDTIYALSTAPGRAGIAIIRISGSSCLDVSLV